MVLTLNFMKMNCVAVIVRFVCGECVKAVNILKSINQLAMLFQWMYSISINLWEQHSLKSNAFALWHGMFRHQQECILVIGFFISFSIL